MAITPEERTHREQLNQEFMRQIGRDIGAVALQFEPDPLLNVERRNSGEPIRTFEIPADMDEGEIALVAEGAVETYGHMFNSKKFIRREVALRLGREAIQHEDELTAQAVRRYVDGNFTGPISRMASRPFRRELTLLQQRKDQINQQWRDSLTVAEPPQSEQA